MFQSCVAISILSVLLIIGLPAFLCALLKDIKSERPKITEKDNLRLLYLTKWFLDFFLHLRGKENGGETWSFGLISEVIERGWIIWVLKRMRGAVEEIVCSSRLSLLNSANPFLVSQNFGQNSKQASTA